jgi:hypothetical protein
MDKKDRDLIERIGLDPDEEEKKEQLKSKKVYEKFKDRADKFNSVGEVLTMTGIDNWNLAKVSHESISFAREGLFVNVEKFRNDYTVSISNGSSDKRFAKEESFIEALEQAYHILSKLESRENYSKAKEKLKKA